MDFRSLSFFLFPSEKDSDVGFTKYIKSQALEKYININKVIEKYK